MNTADTFISGHTYSGLQHSQQPSNHAAADTKQPIIPQQSITNQSRYSRDTYLRGRVLGTNLDRGVHLRRRRPSNEQRQLTPRLRHFLQKRQKRRR